MGEHIGTKRAVLTDTFLQGEVGLCIFSIAKMNLPEILREPCVPAGWALRMFSFL